MILIYVHTKKEHDASLDKLNRLMITLRSRNLVILCTEVLAAYVQAFFSSEICNYKICSNMNDIHKILHPNFRTTTQGSVSM